MLEGAGKRGEIWGERRFGGSEVVSLGLSSFSSGVCAGVVWCSRVLFFSLSLLTIGPLFSALGISAFSFFVRAFFFSCFVVVVAFVFSSVLTSFSPRFTFYIFVARKEKNKYNERRETAGSGERKGEEEGGGGES